MAEPTQSAETPCKCDDASLSWCDDCIAVMREDSEPPKSTAASAPDVLERPPWSQPLTQYESNQMLAAARRVGGEVLSWAITAHYVQSALAYRVVLLEMELQRVNKRYANARRVRRELRASAAAPRDCLRSIADALETHLLNGSSLSPTQMESMADAARAAMGEEPLRAR